MGVEVGISTLDRPFVVQNSRTSCMTHTHPITFKYSIDYCSPVGLSVLQYNGGSYSCGDAHLLGASCWLNR